MTKKYVKIIYSVALTAILLLSVTPVQAFEIQWFGQSAFKITTPGGKVILIDPFISKNPKTPNELKDLSKLGKIDLILVTHGHGDHVGDTAQVSETSGAKVAMNADMGHTFAALGWVPYDRLIRFNKSGPIMPLGDDIRITMVHAEHSSDVVHTDSATQKKTVHPGGEPCGYIIELENGFKIYHAGDTGVFSDMKIIGDYYKPDLALLPIGGHFTMDPAHAAYAVRDFLKVSRIIPMHYGTFPPLKGTPQELKKQLAGYSAEVIVMEPGEKRNF
ncbi:MAG: metal-dependent hydrolase [Desulfobacterales bacterium]|nr:MAG: metal-dependent hydrolase [Desulfobacterales bacterium]